MHITRIELENIKSHAAASFEFTRGTTAITGANGSGKTTIIEAVAWTLFDLLDYKKEDFVTRGQKKGSARVTFESGLDQRLYTVYRDTATGYNVYDPALKARIADKKEEVARFLWQHLGVEPGTDLESLFRRAIGVPQGTFTAVFLETPAERKRAFDKLLKVEEYRRSAEELLKTSRFIEQETNAVRERIARAEGEIARINAVDEEHRQFVVQVNELTIGLESNVADTTQKQGEVETLDRAEAELLAARIELDKYRNEQTRSAITFGQRESELARSREAATKLSEVRVDFERYSAAILRLSELERERGEREKLREQLSKVETALATVRAGQKYSQQALDAALRAHARIAELSSAASQQEKLESEVARLRDSFSLLKGIRNQIAALDEKIGRLRESYRANKLQLSTAMEKSSNAGGRATLEKRDEEIVRELASLDAALERDERFQREIKNGLCPLLSQKCLNLKEGETLETFVSSQFNELRTRIAKLKTEHGSVATALATSREAEKYLEQLATLQAREKEIADEGKLLSEEKSSLQSQIETLPAVERELEKAEKALNALDNPKATIQMLTLESRRGGELRQELSKIESNIERLESDRKILVQQLESYKDFDMQWAEQANIRETTSAANRIYLANETLATLVSEREQQFEIAKKETDELDARLAGATEVFDAAERNYDRGRHDTERAALLNLQKRQAEIKATLDAAQKRMADLAAELERLSEIRASIEAEFRERERLEKVSELTTFVRDTLKEAAPLVARNYVHHVSLEANQLFREITGNAEHTLNWGEDYAISLEEGGYDRPFASFSGGEQMAASLSVRLALLKQLTDIRIAFFDEPTTNLDAERRENLAVQLSHVTHFDQLFVISHDDTFEGYVDNVIHLERDQHEQALQQSI